MDNAAWNLEKALRPPAPWSEKCSLFVNWTESHLWLNKSAEDVRICLQASGLSEETIKAFRLGWNPDNYLREPTEWGLPKDLGRRPTASHSQPGKLTKEHTKIWLPRGLVIPWFDDQNRLIRVRIRQYDRVTMNYFLVAGSSTEPMILGGNEEVFVIVESEFDAILLNQEIGDMAGVIAMGSAQARPDSLTTDILQNAGLILVSFVYADNLEAEDACQWWLDNFSQAKLWPPTDGQNLSEMWRNDENLMEWVDAGIEKYTQEQAPPDDQSKSLDLSNTGGLTPIEVFRAEQVEIENQISALEQRILEKLQGRTIPIKVSNTSLIHNIADFARGAAYRIITGGKYGDYDREILGQMGIAVGE